MIHNPDSSIERQEYHAILANAAKLDKLERLLCNFIRTTEAHLDTILITQAAVLEIVTKIDEEEQPEPETASVANVFTGANPMADNVLVMNVGDIYTDTLTPRLADGVTPSGGVVSNVVVTFSDPSATAVVNADGTITFTGVAASAGPISGSSAFNVTDTDGAVSSWTVPFTVETDAIIPPPPPEQLTQSVANVFTKAA